MVHYTQEKLRNEGFVYSTDLFGNLKRVMAWTDPNNSSSFNNWDIDTDFGEVDKGDYVEGCVCGHHIMYEYKAIHETTGDTMESGSKCIDRLSDEIRIRRNEIN